MKNFSIRISKALIGLLTLSTFASIGYAQTIRVNGVVCTQLPLSVSVTASGTDITVPAACVGTIIQPQVCSGAPTITSFSPATGPVGTTIAVNGTNLCPGATVTINGTAATSVITGTGTSLTAVVASGTTGVGKVAITTSGNPTATSATDFTVTVVQTPVGCSGSNDCSVEDDVIPTPSRTVPGGVTAARGGKLNGGGSSLNAYAAANVASKCSNATPAVTRLWQHNINFATYQTSGGNDYPFLSANEAMTYRFTAPAEGTSNIIQYNEGTQVFFASGYLSISDKPCDFDVSKLTSANRNACHSSEVNGVSIYYKATNGAVASYECKMVPGQTYYLNVRMQDARPASRGGSPTIDSCAASGAGVCGGYVQIR
jgi:hypothetical protein